MDVILTRAEGGTVWQLTDLLGRSMGRITASAPRQFVIHPEGHASETIRIYRPAGGPVEVTRKSREN
jgi:hypothetical protein